VADVCVLGVRARDFALLLFLAYRLLRGRAIWRRAHRKSEFEGEDAELLQLPPDELRERAERFAAQGQFREALRHRFIAVLVRFDRHSVWRYDVRRTNWEHISALQRDATKRTVVEPLSDITRRFDRVRYGGADCDPEGMATFRRRRASVGKPGGRARFAPRSGGSRTMKRRPKWLNWAILGGLVTALLVASVALQPKNLSSAPAASFDDASPTGGKGFALLMNRLGFQSRVQYAPLARVPADARAWFIFNPKAAFSKREANDLLKWVERGGTLVWCAPPPNGFGFSDPDSGAGITTLRTELGVTPASNWTPPVSPKSGQGPLPALTPFRFGAISVERSGVSKAQASSTKLELGKPHLPLADAPGAIVARIERGKGRVYVFADAWMFTNYGLSKPDNAVFASNLVRAPLWERGLTDGGGVYFDERQHDEGGAPPEIDSVMARLRKPPFSYALWQLLVAGLLTWAFVGRRLGSASLCPNAAL
jgi:hypothetical protein